MWLTGRDEVDVKKKRTSDPMCTMNSYVDQSVKVRKLKHGSSDEVSLQHVCELGGSVVRALARDRKVASSTPGQSATE